MLMLLKFFFFVAVFTAYWINKITVYPKKKKEGKLLKAWDSNPFCHYPNIATNFKETKFEIFLDYVLTF